MYDLNKTLEQIVVEIECMVEDLEVVTLEDIKEPPFDDEYMIFEDD